MEKQYLLGWDTHQRMWEKHRRKTGLVWAQRRNPSDTQSSTGTDCCVLNSHHLSRAFPWALFVQLLMSFYHPPAVWPITSGGGCVHFQVTPSPLARSCPGGLLPSCHVHCMTRVPVLLLSPLPPISSSLPLSSPRLELALLRKRSGFMWVWLTCSQALHRHG